MMTRASMDWRKLLLGMSLRFLAIIRKEHAEVSTGMESYILDDTTLEKTGFSMEQISRVFDHVQGKCVLGYKLLVCAFFDGKSTIPIDLLLHCEKGKKKDFGLASKQRKKRFAKQRNAENPNAIRFNESTESKLKVAVDMIKRAWSHKCLRAKYVLCDSWFTCEYLIGEVRKLGKGALHLGGLAKMGNAKYLVHGKLHNALELIALYERERSHNCRQYKCHYISLQGKLGEQTCTHIPDSIWKKPKMERFDKHRFVYDFCESFRSLPNPLEHRSLEQRMQTVSRTRQMPWKRF